MGVRIPGYKLGEVVGRGAGSVVYRAEREGGGESYAVKVLKSDDVDAGLRFRQEAAALARLNHPGLVKVIETGEAEGSSYIVMEFVEGQTLAAQLENGPISEAQTVALAKGLAGALGEVHRHGLVHRDLKPSNIVVTHGGQAKIIDFGFVGRAQAEDDAPEDQVVGTFLYAPPEQTGMLRRPVDGRSDLYALGCVLYECLTGRTPFLADSVAELLKQHAAVRAKAVVELSPRIGRTVSAVVEKLLAKDPDDRYQNARSLLADLEDLSSLESACSEGRELHLGSKGPQPRLSAEIPMVGRKEELEGIKKAWENAKAGRGSIVQIEGEPGMGKTRLAREVIALAEEQSALVLMGKAQKAERIPFGVLREAGDAYIARSRRLPKAERQEHLDRLRRAAGDMAGIVRRLSPSLRRLLKEAPDIPPLDRADEEQRRFYERVAAFLTDMARENEAMVLVVDDAQWLDDGTREVLARLSALVSSAPLLVVTTVRTDLESNEGRQAFMAMVGQEKVEEVALSSLDDEGVKEFIAANLGGRGLDDSVLKLLSTRSGGNPFALGEYLRSLLDQGLIRPTADGWRVVCELEDIELPDDVIQVLVGRVAKLGADAAQVLSTSAVVGFTFAQEVVVGALDDDESLVLRGLEQGLRAGLVERLDERRFQFIHDRISEALLADLAVDQLKDIHQDIADSIGSVMDEGPELVYALARHYAEGHGLRNLRRVYETSLAAGKLALESYSNEEALKLLERAHSISQTIESSSKEQAELDELLGDVCTRAAHFERARAHLDSALSHAGSDEDSTRLHVLKSQSYLGQTHFADAWLEMRQALALHGLKFPERPLLRLPYLLYFLLAVFLAQRAGLGFGRSKGKNLARRERIADLLLKASKLSYWLNDPSLMIFIMLRYAHHAHALGTHALTAQSLVVLSVLMASVSRHESSLHLAERAVEMARQIGDLAALRYCQLIRCYVLELSGYPDRSQECLSEIIPKARKVCMSWDWSTLEYMRTISKFFLGKTSEALPGFYENLKVLERLGTEHQINTVKYFIDLSHTLLGRPEEGAHLKADAEQYDERVQADYFRAIGLEMKIMKMVDRMDIGPELDACYAEYTELISSSYVDFPFHITMGYGLVERARFASTPSARDGAVAQLKRLIRSISKPTRNGRIHPTICCHLDVLQAAIARVSRRYHKASTLLDRADKTASLVKSVWCLWAAHRERARLLRQQGDEQQAQSEAKKTLSVALEQGWANRISQTREEFGLEDEESPIDESRTDSDNTATAEALSAQRYVDALLEVSLASSSTLEPAEQCRAALDALVRVLGAERAFLFHTRDSGGLEMQAGRDSNGEDLLPLTGFSSTVVKKVYESGEPVVVTGTEEGEAFGSESAVAHELRSIMATPLELRGQKMGVVYVDSRMAKGLFTQEHVDILRAIASHLAIAVDTARRARDQSAELERAVKERTTELRELNERLQQEVVVQASNLEQARSLERYLPPHVAQAVLDGEQLLERQRRRVTAFRLELSGFEQVTEQVDAEELSAMLNSYLSELTDVALEHGATLERFDNDALSGVFGAPTSEGEDQDARRCATMALELWERATDVCERWQDLLDGEPPKPTMVLSTGEAIVGSFGSPRRMEYTAIGGPVDETRQIMGQLAAGQLVCAETTWRHLKGEYEATTVKSTGSGMTLHRLTGDPQPEAMERAETRPAREIDRPNVTDSASLEPPTLKTGAVIASRYELQAKLGEGGMGSVFRARDQKLDEEVALKLIRSDLRDDAESVKRLRREVKLARLVSHRNVARIYDLDEWAGGELISMEHVRGQTLTEHLKNGLLPIDEALDVLRQLCAGLSAAHAAGVVHRDLKPSNIMLEPSGRVVILDFGVSTWTSRRTATETKGSLGTPQYMAPEQFLGEKVTTVTDIYALGVVAFEVLTGSLPFEAENAVALALKHSEDAPPDLLELRPELSPRIAAVVLRCLEKRPRDRFESAGAVGSLLG